MILLYGCSMYQVLLDSGDYKSADIFLNEIPSVLSGFASDMKKHYFAKMDDVLVSDTYDWQNGSNELGRPV
jgi:hypothetical protein